MNQALVLLEHYGPAFLGGGTIWMVYAAIWKHAPARFPRTIDEWWSWIRGANQEIAAQHAGALPPNPSQPQAGQTN